MEHLAGHGSRDLRRTELHQQSVEDFLFELGCKVQLLQLFQKDFESEAGSGLANDDDVVDVEVADLGIRARHGCFRETGDESRGLVELQPGAATENGDIASALHLTR